MIIRGTTPYHNFILPMAADDIDTVYITYAQNEEIVFEKTNLNQGEVVIVDVNTEEDEEQKYCQLTTHLTQEDTLSFKFFPAARKNIAIAQIRILDINEEAYVSDPIRERIFGVFHEGVIANDG